MNTQRKHWSRKKLGVILLALLVVVLIAGGLYLQRHHLHRNQTAAVQNPVGPNYINYSPPTQAEKDSGNAAKDKALQQMNADQQAATNPPSTKQVKPVITNISNVNGQITVTAYTPGIFENGGTCTLTATKDTQTVSFTSQAFANATTTDCTPFRLKPSQFPGGGTWTFKVAYSSSTASGSSDTQSYKVI